MKADKTSVKITNTLKELSDKHPELFWKILIDEPLQLPRLEDREVFIRSDDGDGQLKGIEVFFLDNGDGILEFKSVDNFRSFGNFHTHRFRTWSGGSMSPMIQKMLHLLAYAVNLSERELPERMKNERKELDKVDEELKREHIYDHRDMD